MTRALPRHLRDRRTWAALTTFEQRRNPVDHRLDRYLPEDPGVVHAYRITAKGGPEFYDGDGPASICGTRVRVRLPVEFNGEDPDACPRCASEVARGVQAFRDGRPPRDVCMAMVRPAMEGQEEVVVCHLLDHHDGPHRGSAGETWDKGAADFTPAPDGYA